MDNTAQKQTDSASTSAATSKTSLMRSASLEAKERGALVSLSAEDVLRVLDSNTELLDALQRLIKECEWQAEIGNMNGERIEFGAARAAIAKATQP